MRTLLRPTGSGRALQIVVWPIIFPVSRYPPDGMMRQHGSAARVPESRAAIPRRRAQNTRYVVVLRFVEENRWPSQVVMAGLLPAGFEIEDPRLEGSADIDRFDWFDDVDAAHVAFRDDRFTAGFTRDAQRPRARAADMSDASAASAAMPLRSPS
ncbi:MAG: hypothetical protein HLUCCO17_03080 [Saliniramus fredricksonii]|uniref:Bacterial alpha-2-macroglobulin MG10 domain-containing protein n=1 Tax=Saliniramus fredricksonii TaxID=1653334 RepID=A0A0P8AAK2_9HYPH|nr:hypothetical protein [Saliniramus fredricksonii]KPQ12160.1 MAG: hypothetical protein HLUCCO17_03080 [Saliniramus fredricksonii]SCC78787.1 hypothetical protein GA0071312_0492 [Saliniramus fredricksonii]